MMIQLQNFSLTSDGEQSRIITQGPRGLPDLVHRPLLGIPVLEKTAMLLPGHVDKNAEPLGQGVVEKLPLRRKINAQAVRSEK